jgi:hypothetical protein
MHVLVTENADFCFFQHELARSSASSHSFVIALPDQ